MGTQTKSLRATRRRCQRAIQAPAQPAEPSPQRRLFESSLDCPIRKALSSPVVGQLSAVATICLLPVLCGPPAVAGLVAAFVVDPIQFCAGGSQAHVGQKVDEAAPAGTHANAATAPARKVFRSPVRASLDHRPPRSVRAAGNEAVSRSSLVSGNNSLRVQAATTLRGTSQQTCSADRHIAAAITSANPVRVMVLVARVVSDDQPAKALADAVLEGRSTRNRMRFSHDGLPPLWLEPQRADNTSAARFILSRVGEGAIRWA
jgi:hypothetical protein